MPTAVCYARLLFRLLRDADDVPLLLCCGEAPWCFVFMLTFLMPDIMFTALRHMRLSPHASDVCHDALHADECSAAPTAAPLSPHAFMLFHVPFRAWYYARHVAARCLIFMMLCCATMPYCCCWYYAMLLFCHYADAITMLRYAFAVSWCYYCCCLMLRCLPAVATVSLLFMFFCSLRLLFEYAASIYAVSCFIVLFHKRVILPAALATPGTLTIVYFFSRAMRSCFVAMPLAADITACWVYHDACSFRLRRCMSHSICDAPLWRPLCVSYGAATMLMPCRAFILFAAAFARYAIDYLLLSARFILRYICCLLFTLMPYDCRHIARALLFAAPLCHVFTYLLLLFLITSRVSILLSRQPLPVVLICCCVCWRCRYFLLPSAMLFSMMLFDAAPAFAADDIMRHASCALATYAACRAALPLCALIPRAAMLRAAAPMRAEPTRIAARPCACCRYTLLDAYAMFTRRLFTMPWARAPYARFAAFRYFTDVSFSRSFVATIFFSLLMRRPYAATFMLMFSSYVAHAMLPYAYTPCSCR